MPIPLAAVLGAAGIGGFLLWAGRSKYAGRKTLVVTCTDPNGCTTRGVNTRSAPNADAPIVEPNDADYGTEVELLETKVYPPTPGAPEGWVRIRTPGGAVGYASAQWLR